MSGYFLEPNAAGTAFTGSGFSLDGMIPAGAIACTQAQAENPYAYVPDMSTTPPSIVAAPSAQLLAQAQAQQIATLSAAYQQAIQQPVSYTSKGGVTKTYQADAGSAASLQSKLLAFSTTQTTPPDFYWVAADNTQVPFTYADLQGLMQVLGVQAEAAFQRLQTLKNQVRAATSIAAVQAITW